MTNNGLDIEAEAPGNMAEIPSSELPLVAKPSAKRTLKHQDTFLVCSASGDIFPDESNEEGIYFDGTRFISKLILRIDGVLPVVLGSYVRDQNDCLIVHLTNDAGSQNTRTNSIAIRRSLFLYEESCYVSVECENFSSLPCDLHLSWELEADYADIYEIRGMPRSRRGELQKPRTQLSEVLLGYLGLDEELRTTRIEFLPKPELIRGDGSEYRIRLQPRDIFKSTLTLSCRRSRRLPGKSPDGEEAARLIEEQQLFHNQNTASLLSSNTSFTEWFSRSQHDLHLMLTELPTGPYPYAGVPWFNTPFGRDGLISALQSLWIEPRIARGVLSYLAETQAQEEKPEEDAQPGKILHEIRSGEMAALKEMPFGRYYGSVDATPLFVVLAGAYYERTADLDFIRRLWPSVRAALRWMEIYGDADGDGFLEYQRHASNGLIHQGWKDSDDAIFHADGRPAEGALALAEVQSYAYGALRAGAILSEALGHFEVTASFTSQAETLQRRFNEVFWCDKLSTYGIALDGEKRLCAIRSSNAGHCLLCGIAPHDRALRVADTLLSQESFSGWGIRTLPASSVRYNPMSYHNGSVWPHDNGLIALGMARYGLNTHVRQIFEGIFAAATYFERYRLPELFCGFSREERMAPVSYPVACAPQAWAASTVFGLTQALLGLKIDSLAQQVSFTKPTLPKSIGDLRIMNLTLPETSIAFTISGCEEDLSIRPHSELNGWSLLRF